MLILDVTMGVGEQLLVVLPAGDVAAFAVDDLRDTSSPCRLLDRFSAG
jgi:hypothetical protein